MPELAIRLTSAAGRPVLDKTNLDGRYGFMLVFTPSQAVSANSAESSNAPDLFTAVTDQLGLKLNPAKERVEVLVIDGADKIPADN